MRHAKEVWILKNFSIIFGLFEVNFGIRVSGGIEDLCEKFELRILQGEGNIGCQSVEGLNHNLEEIGELGLC